MSERAYPEKLEVKPLERPINARIRVPGSKSISNRALVMAALASRRGACRITGMLLSEDTEVMLSGLRQLGFSLAVAEGEHGADVTVKTTNPLVTIPARHADLFVGN